jgi:hypothetical protein
MRSRRHHQEQHWRHELIQEAARLMAESGIESFELAKRKARDRLHLPATAALPRNDEIEAALLSYRSLFGGEEHGRALLRLRRVAADAMQGLEQFRPRLVGPVLSGTADEHSVITLHLFAESAEEVAFFLIDAGIPFRHTERRLRMNTGAQERVPGYCFGVDDAELELLVFCGKLERQAVLSPVDARPMRRASRRQVLELVNPDPPAPG